MRLRKTSALMHMNILLELAVFLFPPVLPSYDAETVLCDGMVCLLYIPMDGGRLF